MAKIAMTKLGLSKNNDIETVEFNGQKVEVKKYLPIEDKLKLVSDIINSSLDKNNFYNPGRIEIYQTLNIIMNYTNINFTDKQKEDVYKLYDLLVGSGLADLVINAIPKSEISFIHDCTMETIRSIYAYNNSIMGILDNISSDYNTMNLDIDQLWKKMGDQNNLALLRNVMSNLG